jgi:murein DD-endopeptidase MepM/ murein hydrolase activator NlpD
MPAESFMRHGIAWGTFKGVVRTAVATVLHFAFSALGQPVSIVLPTENHGLLNGDNAAFYQYVKRDFEGVVSTPWEGGQYGFVRNPRRFGATVLDTRFHEGMDIRPLHRVANGEPLDVIHAIAAGNVVYANNVPSASNYGRYIVIEHQFGGCPYFSLYAHLSAIDVAIGNRVPQGDTIAVMGHTGEGIDRERSHVHLELNLLLNSDFERWSKKYFQGDGNRHGNFNGQNLDGLDIARLYLELAKNPKKTIPEFLQEEAIWYRVLVPASPRMDLLQRYPWLSGGQTAAQSWEISFNQAGIPLRFEARTQSVAKPVLTWVKFSPYPYPLQTRGYIEGSGSRYLLSKDGERYLDLISPEE